MNVQEFLDSKGLNYIVGLDSLHTSSGAVVKGFKATVRRDTGGVLGVVTPKYKVIQTLEALSLGDAIKDIAGGEFANAGTLKGGALAYLQLKLPNDIVIPGKENEGIQKMLTLTTSHDGSTGARGCFSAVRIVCENTFALSWATREGDSFSIRHSAQAEERIKQASTLLKNADLYFKGAAKRMELLAITPFSDAQMTRLVEELVPSKAEGDNVGTRAQGIRDELQTLFVHGRGHEDIRGSAWAAYNAVTEYVDHHRGTRVAEGQDPKAMRFESAFMGSGKAMKDNALPAILELTGLGQQWATV